MKETAKVDQSIVNNFDILFNMFGESQEKWLTSRDTRVNIYFYYAAKNAGLVVSRMKERFLSNETPENPKIVEESLQVMGLLGEILNLTQDEKPDEAATKVVMERVKELRTFAINTKLMQAQEKELEDVDKLLNYLSRLRK